MKKYRLVLLLACVLAAGPGRAQTLIVHNDGAAADLRCPAVIPKKAPAKRTTDSDEVMEPPALYELAGMDTGGKDEAIPRLFSTRVRHVADRPLSIAFWGDSHLAANFFGDELVRLSGLPRSKVEATFIPATMGRPGVRLPVRKSCQGGGWSYRLAYQDKSVGTSYAQGLSVLSSSTANSYIWVDFRQQAQTPNLRSLDVAYAAQDGANAVLAVSTDDGAEQIVTLDATGQGTLHIQPDQAMSTIRLRLVEGSLNLEGFVPHYVETKPALLLDTFAIPGATFKGWGSANPDYLKARLGKTQYDVVVFEYGTNEGNVRVFDGEAYRNDLRDSLTNMRRVLPDSQCILMGPADRGVLVKHARAGKKARQEVVPASADLLRFARIHQQIGAIQRSVGGEFGCSFWSWQDAMGGPGSVYKWFYHSPRWMSPDLTHLSIPGYQMTAQLFADSIQFQNWVSTNTNVQ